MNKVKNKDALKGSEVIMETYKRRNTEDGEWREGSEWGRLKKRIGCKGGVQRRVSGGWRE